MYRQSSSNQGNFKFANQHLGRENAKTSMENEKKENNDMGGKSPH